MNKKAQSSLELTVTVGIILILFVIVMVFSQMKIKEANEYTRFLDAKTICRSMANNIDTIAEQGSGYYRYLSIPKNVKGGYKYNLVTYTKFVEIQWEDSTLSPWNTQITTNKVSFCCEGNCSTGNKSLGKLSKGLSKRNKVYSEDGSVFVSCDMPDLKFFPGTFMPKRTLPGENITARVEVMNFGPEDVNKGFQVRMTNTDKGVSKNKTINQLRTDKYRMVSMNFTAANATGNYTLEIDPLDNVSEAIENNNNVTVEVKGP